MRQIHRILLVIYKLMRDKVSFLSANSFKDLDGDVLTYTATLENGDPLPSWLIFNQNTLGLVILPSFSDAGVLQITVVASDGSLTAAQTFALQIQM